MMTSLIYIYNVYVMIVARYAFFRLFLMFVTLCRGDCSSNQLNLRSCTGENNLLLQKDVLSGNFPEAFLHLVTAAFGG